jgi:tRNA A37 threonylcarbamoyladenosine modification protein TsaB
VIGLAIERATEHVEILVRGAGGETLAHEVEEVGHGHTRRLTPLIAQALDEAGIRPRDLGVARSGPGSFYRRVRAALATAESARARSGADVAPSLAPLAHAAARAARPGGPGAGRPPRSLRRVLPRRRAAA